MAAPAITRELPPRLELQCLKTLWSLRQASVRDIQESLAVHRPLAYTTVMTIMDRLSRRGFVRREKSGRTFIYSPLLTEDCVRKAAVQELIENLFGGCEEALRVYLRPSDQPRYVEKSTEIQ